MLLRFLDIAHDYDTQAVDDNDDDGGIDDGVNDDDIDVGGIFFFQTLVSGDGDGDDDDIDDGTQAQEKRVEDEQRAAAFAAEQHKCREAEMRER